MGSRIYKSRFHTNNQVERKYLKKHKYKDSHEKHKINIMLNRF